MKSKKSDSIKKDSIESYKGFTVGDSVWFKPFSGDARPILGTITNFYPTDSLGPAVSLRESVRGRYTVTLVSSLLKDTPTAAVKRHIREIAKLNININKKKKKNK